MRKTKFAKIFLAAAVCAAAIMLFAACNANDVYDNDALIIRGGASMTVGSSESNIPGQSYALKAKKFSGVKAVTTLDLPENPVIYIKLTLWAGKCKVVLIKDDKVNIVCEQTAETDAELAEMKGIAKELSAGRYQLKFVGQNVENIDIKIDLKKFS